MPAMCAVPSDVACGLDALILIDFEFGVSLPHCLEMMSVNPA